MLGQNVTVRVSSDVAAIPIEKPSTSYIWPVCLPKDDDDDGFTPSPVIPVQLFNPQVSYYISLGHSIKIKPMIGTWLTLVDTSCHMTLQRHSIDPQAICQGCTIITVDNS